MGLLLAAAARDNVLTTTSTTTTTTTYTYSEDGPPYALPTEAPYNVPTYAITPTPDGTGSAIHPSVIDFHTLVEGGKWNGYRYWNAVSDFWNSNEAELENQCILQSSDGYHWRVPDGLINPVYPSPPNWPDKRWHSDQDIEYDPVNDRLVMVFRTRMEDLTHQFFISESYDGVTWSPAPIPLNWTIGSMHYLSPALIYKGPNDWYMLVGGRDTQKYYWSRATDPLGQWTTPQQLGWPTPPTGYGGATPWHSDAIWDGVKFRIAMYWYYPNPVTGEWDTSLMTPGTWGGDPYVHPVWGSTSFLGNGPTGSWDSGQLYRPSFAPHEDGIHYRFWYSAHGPYSWRIGYTQVPKSLWPA